MNKCKRGLKWFIKAICGVLIAVIAASFVCLIYYHLGVHVENPTGATDYVWESNQLASKMTEGIAWKKADDNGFFSNVVPSDNIDILLMGSSHMEGTNVFDQQTVTAILNEMLDLSLYNIGISSHNLMVNAKNLDSALDTYAPSEYVILETSSTTFSDSQITEVLNQTMSKIPSYDSGILFYLQQIPYFRLVYFQYQQLQRNHDARETEETISAQDKPSPELYDAFAKYIADICEEHDVQPIIFYHPNLSLVADGTVTTNVDEDSLPLFQSVCENHEILFVDMTQDFLDMYYEESVLPNGFCNTAVGTGHLNKYGHNAIAERLAQVITEAEEAKEVTIK